MGYVVDSIASRHNSRFLTLISILSYRKIPIGIRRSRSYHFVEGAKKLVRYTVLVMRTAIIPR